MLHYPLWRRIVVIGLVVLGLVFAAPNLFYPRVEAHNDAAAEIEAFGRTPDREAALAGWPGWLPSSLVNLGLDLRGGAQLLAEVQVEDVYVARMDALWPEVRDVLRELRGEVGAIRRIEAPDGLLQVRIENPDSMSVALDAVRGLATNVVSLTGIGAQDIDVGGEGDVITVQLSEAEKLATDDRTLQQSVEIIRRRVDEVGTREPSITRQGERRILVQVPGVGSAEEIKTLIGTTAQLTFQPVVSRTTDPSAAPGPRQEVLPSLDEEGVWYVLEQTPVVTGEELTNAQPSFDQNGRPAVNFQFLSLIHI